MFFVFVVWSQDEGSREKSTAIDERKAVEKVDQKQKQDQEKLIHPGKGDRFIVHVLLVQYVCVSGRGHVLVRPLW